MPINTLDRFDRAILEHLQRNGRMTNLELAEKIGLSPTPCSRRLKELESTGVIKFYIAQLDREKVGLGLTSFVAVRLTGHREDESAAFRRAVLDMPEVTACYITTGEHDFLLQVVSPDLAGYRRFVFDQLTKLPQVKDIHSSIALEIVKEDSPLPLRHIG